MRVRGGDYIRGGTPGSRLRPGIRSGIRAAPASFNGVGTVEKTPLAGVEADERFGTAEIHFENRVWVKEWVHESGTIFLDLHYDNITLELWESNDD